MKTFREFLEECYSISESSSRTEDGRHATSRTEAESMGLSHFLPPDGEWRVLRPSGRGRGKTVKKASSVAGQKLRRKHRGAFATHPDANLKLTAKKITRINQGLNKQAHHIYPLERLSHMKDMTPEQRKAYIERRQKDKEYLGNDRRATMAVSPEEHERMHEFERRHHKNLEGMPISSTPAYNILRKKTRQLQRRMSRAADRFGID